MNRKYITVIIKLLRHKIEHNEQIHFYLVDEVKLDKILYFYRLPVKNTRVKMKYICEYDF